MPCCSNHFPVSHPENLVRLVEVHPKDFITWNLPYDFCDAIAGRDADLSEVICQGEADLAASDGNSTERVCGSTWSRRISFPRWACTPISAAC